MAVKPSCPVLAESRKVITGKDGDRSYMVGGGAIRGYNSVALCNPSLPPRSPLMDNPIAPMGPLTIEWKGTLLEHKQSDDGQSYARI